MKTFEQLCKDNGIDETAVGGMLHEYMRENNCVLKTSERGLFFEALEYTEDEKTANAKRDWQAFVAALNKSLGRRYKDTNATLLAKFKARLKEGYTLQDFLTALQSAKQSENHINSNFQYLTPEFFTRADKLERFINNAQKKYTTKPTISDQFGT